MRKIFSLGRKQITVIITLAILGAAAFWYYMGYVPNNEQALNEQHFRWLQKTDENIRAKIVANDTLLANLLRAYITNPSKNNVADYINGYPISDASLICSIDSVNTVKTQATGPEQANNKNIRDTGSVQFILGWDADMNKLILSASKKEQGKVYTVMMKYDFEKFIRPLLIDGLFDHYVVFYEGRYIYEDFHSGLGYDSRKEDSLLTTGKSMTGANIIKQKIGGVDYNIFLQPINFFGDKKLIISGLLSRKRTDAAKKQLPPGIAILAVTIALGILLFLPWIKIYFQGKYDRVTLRDAGESVLVAKLLMSLIILLFFTYNNPFRPNPVFPKKVLANAIDSAFNREVDSAYKCLENFDTLMKKYNMFYDVINLNNDSIKFVRQEEIFNRKKYSDSLQNTLKDSLNKFKKLLEYYEVNWLGSDGGLKYGWTMAGQNNIHANYRDRKYFKGIDDNHSISLKIAPDDPIFIDQIISRTSNTFRTIISKRSSLDSIKAIKNRAHVVALSFGIKSLDKVIMPAGYSFAIIDNTGYVRYHSKPERNLNENLLEEFSQSEDLDNALQGRFEKALETKYYEGDYSVLVRPLKGFPYFIVIMDDNSFHGSVQIETFSFVWGMVLVFLLVVVLDLFILISASSRRSLFKKQYFVTSWLWPRAGCGSEYIFASIGNSILATVLLVIFTCCSQFIDYLSYLFLLFVSIPLSTIFINSLFLNKYRAEKNKSYQSYKVRCNRYSLVFLALLNVFAFRLLGLSSFWHILIIQIAVVPAGLLLLYFHRTAINANSHIAFSKKAYLNYFTLMIFTRLLITSAIPVIFFCIASYNFENNLLGRYRQYAFATQLQEKFPGKMLPAAPHNSTAVYCDSLWIKKVSIVKNNKAYTCDSLSKNQKITARLFSSFGFYLEGISKINNDNFYKSSYDNYFCFNNFFDNVLYGDSGNTLRVDRELYSPESNRYNSLKDHVEIFSGKLNYAFPQVIDRDGFIFWLMLLAAMFCFCIIIRAVIKKVCSLDLEKVSLLNKTGSPIRQLITHNKQASLIWISGLLTDEIVQSIKLEIDPDDLIPCLDFEDIKPGDKKPKDIDVQQLDENNFLFHLKQPGEKESAWKKAKSKVINSASGLAILLHIESSLDDEKINEEKLDCIKALLDKKKKVIVVSRIHPQQMKEVNDFKNEKIKNATASKLIDIILNNSTVVTRPLTQNNYTYTNVNNDTESAEITAMHLYLDKETKYTLFLKELRNLFLLEGIDSGTEKFREDKLTLRMQSLAENFYMDIWHSLSSDEKFILFDFAVDGLVNITNTFPVTMLLNKGLVVEDEGHLRIFSKSFRNFIVSSVDDEEIAKLQLIHKKQSNWSNLQGPLLLIILAVFVFLAIAQEGLYSKVIGVISGVAAGIPALLKLLSIIGMQNDRPSKSESKE